MFRNFLITSLRHLSKNKVFSAINILGLTVGLTCFTIIALYVENECSYDRFHDREEDIYRVVTNFINSDGTIIPDATTPSALSTALRNEVTDVESATRLSPAAGRLYLFEYQDKRFYETEVIRIDTSFFKVFSFPFVKGDAKTATADNRSIVVTESTARKYFGDENPIGKVVRVNLNGGTDYKIAAVLADIPEQSHFRFNFLLPFESRRNPDTDWDRSVFYTYVKLHPGTNIDELSQSVATLFKKNKPQSIDDHIIQRLDEIHLHSDLKWELGVNGDIVRVQVLVVIAIFIVVLGGINYINLSTAQALRRSREVGVRKVAGAFRSWLIFQFLTESVIVVSISLLLSVIVTQLSLPLAHSVFGNDLIAAFNESRYVWFIVPAVAFVIAIGAGMYPAFYMSSFKPVKALKGNVLQVPEGVGLRRALVVCQFAISTILVIGSITIANQLDYMQRKQMGFNADDVLILPNVRGGIGATPVDNDAMLREMGSLAGVENVSRADGILGFNNSVTGVSTKGTNHTALNFIRIDYEFIPTLQLDIIAGRNFSNRFPSDSAGIILNETAATQLGLDHEAIGEQIEWDDASGTHPVTILGIVKDFHFRSLRETIKPFGFILEVGNGSNFFVRVNSKRQQQTIAEVSGLWKRHAPEHPFDYIFQNAPLAQFHIAETRFQKLVTGFTAIAIIIACLGLFGLVTYLTDLKTKEIGIRKLLGASLPHLVQLMSRDFFLLIIIALTLSIPISWYIMNRWLESFAYHSDFQLTTVLAAIMSILLVTLFTMGYKIVHTALRNPADSLKNE
ncbi:ABC transporter permease [Chryseolinea sp. T2]|uniref:ABC transporter permease n=1 Tax=Chryseolinea sp. T2 TaxID=3129255 RepID=UPI0030786602